MITTTIRGLALKNSCTLVWTIAKSGLVDQMLDKGTNHTILYALHRCKICTSIATTCEIRINRWSYLTSVLKGF